MNLLEAAKQALEALEDMAEFSPSRLEKQISALRAAIEEAEKQEPAAEVVTHDPTVSREHLLAIAKKCDLIGSYNTREVVDAVTGYAQVVLRDKAVQEAFLRANPYPAPAVPEGWIRAIDEAMVCSHLGVANVSDTYEDAKKKLNSLIYWNIDVATNPAVNGGWQLVPKEPTDAMCEAAGNPMYVVERYKAMLAAAPKPEW